MYFIRYLPNFPVGIRYRRAVEVINQISRNPGASPRVASGSDGAYGSAWRQLCKMMLQVAVRNIRQLTDV
jgi:hypothetical protein